MPSFVNTNVHHIYVTVEPSEEHPSGLRKVKAGEEFEVTGRAADIALETPGVAEAGSEEADAFSERWEARQGLIAAPGPAAFPAAGGAEFAGRSGIHVTGRDAGVPVGAESEEAPAPSVEDLGEMTVAELRDLAEERGIEVSSTARKAEIVDMLEAEAELEQGSTTTSESLPESAKG